MSAEFKIKRWVTLEGRMTSFDEEGEVSSQRVWTARELFGDEPALHPLFEERELCDRFVEKLNELEWTEEDYLTHGKLFSKAMDAGDPDLLSQKPSIWRILWRALLGR